MADKRTRMYAQVLWDSSEQKNANPKELVAHLAKHLESQGRIKLLPGILRAFQTLAARNTKLTTSVEVSHANESAQALKEAAAHGILAEHAIVNPSLIKGWRASGEGKLVDASAKRSLIELYRKITTHA
jgi:F0F1-type ATP synthase delta subunit